MNYALNKKMSTNLSKALPVLMKAPNNQEVQLEQIRILSKIDSNPEEFNPSNSYLNSSQFKSATSQNSSRRSKNALLKVSRMKKAYSITRSETLTTAEQDMLNSSGGQPTDSFKMIGDLDDNFDDEVNKIYQWTKNLSINDDIFTPRLPLT